MCHPRRFTPAASLTALPVGFSLNAQTPASLGFTTIHNFTGPADGAWPSGTMITDSSGALYGTTSNGGAWTQRALMPFVGGANGANPEGLSFGPNGSLYGTTLFGGSTANGIVFQVTPPATAGTPWTETVLYNFLGGADGYLCYSSPLVAGNGALYLTTQSGGNADHGTIIQLLSIISPARTVPAWCEAPVRPSTAAPISEAPPILAPCLR